jgi:hypothetical protein
VEIKHQVVHSKVCKERLYLLAPHFRVEVSTQDYLIAHQEPFFDFFLEILPEGVAWVSVIVLAEEVAAVLIPNGSWS